MAKTENKTPAVAEPRAQLIAGGGPVMPIIPRSIEEVYRVATGIVRAKMAPASYKDNPDSVAVGIMHGLEVGLTPLMAIQSIAVINGTPSIWGDGALSLVLASGEVEDIDEKKITDKAGNVVGATCIIKRKGRKTLIEGKFTEEQAKKAGLIGKSGPWTQYPERMYQMRARAWAMRDGFADILRGLKVREEVEDMGEMVEQAQAPARPTRDQYETDKTEAVDVEVEEEQEQEQEEEHPVVYAIFNEIGELVDETESVAVVTAVIGQHVTRITDPAAFNTFVENNAEMIASLQDAGGNHHQVVLGWYQWWADREKKQQEEAAQAEQQQEPETEPAPEPKQEPEKPQPETSGLVIKLHNKAKGDGKDWQRYRQDMIAAVKKLGGEKVGALREANKEILKRMHEESPNWYRVLHDELARLSSQ